MPKTFMRFPNGDQDADESKVVYVNMANVLWAEEVEGKIVLTFDGGTTRTLNALDPYFSVMLDSAGLLAGGNAAPGVPPDRADQRREGA